MILEVSGQNDLESIKDPDVQAVFHHLPKSASWNRELQAAIETDTFQVPRTIMPWQTPGEIRNWLEESIPLEGVTAATRKELIQALLMLVECAQDLTGASQFMIRLFTGRPNCRCGYHVDTVPPGAPAVGILHVFNGASTLYVDSENVTTMSDFYEYLGARERLARIMARAQGKGDRGRYLEAMQNMRRLDTRPPFLRDPANLNAIPAESTIAFKQVDSRIHWSDHPASLAWIHASPSEGAPRLVVNIAGRDQAARGRTHSPSGVTARASGHSASRKDAVPFS